MSYREASPPKQEQPKPKAAKRKKEDLFMAWVGLFGMSAIALILLLPLSMLAQKLAPAYKVLNTVLHAVVTLSLGAFAFCSGLMLVAAFAAFYELFQTTLWPKANPTAEGDE